MSRVSPRNAAVQRACCVVDALEPRRMLAGEGLSTIIFNNDNFTGTNVSRVDATVNATWNYGSPASGIGSDTFAIRWAGEIKPAQSGAHTFRLDRDGGVRLWVDDQLIIDSWSDVRNIVTAPVVQLTAGKRHHIVLEYRDVSNAAWCKLQWNRPGMTSGTFETVPQTVLHPNSRDLNSATNNAGWTNVKSFGAVGDGIADDTTAIRNAIAASKKLFFPNGTYLVSDSLVLATATGDSAYDYIQGQNRDNTIIKLANGASGYDSAATPKPLFSFLDASGDWNQAFRNSINDLTLNVGADNPGAIGLKFHNSNQGGIFNVNVRAEPDAGGSRDGFRGISMTTAGPGPGMMQNVLIDGFTTGLRVDHYDHGFAYDKVTFQNQSSVAISTFQNQFFMENIVARNVPRFFQDNGGSASIILINSDISGSGTAGLYINGRAFIRNTSIDGFTKAVDRVSGTDLADDSVITAGEWLTTSVKSAFGTDRRPTTLGLQIKDAPIPDYDAPANWVIIDGSAADDTQAIKDAITFANANGRTTLVFNANQVYRVSDTITFSGGITHVLGNESSIDPAGSLQNTNKPVFKFSGITAPAIVFERFRTEYPENSGTIVWFEHDTSATVVLKHLTPRGTDKNQSITTAFRNTVNGTGDVFINDVSAAVWRFSHGVKVWARNLNPESRYSGADATNIIVDGSTLWAMNMKTEGQNTIIDARNGSQVELLGGRLEPYDPVASTTPAFKITDSQASLVYSEGSTTSYTIRVQETRGSTTNNYSTGGGWFYSAVPLNAVTSSIAASSATASGNYNLTTQGTADWVKWGRSSVSDFDYKATGGNKISDWSAFNGASVNRTSGSGATHSWSDGAPTASASGNNGYVRTNGADKGFEFTVAADAGVARTLKIYLGGQYSSLGVLELLFDDASAAPITLNLNAGSGTTEWVATVDFTAASATNLRVRYTAASGTGNVFLRAASLA